jgi:integrase
LTERGREGPKILADLAGRLLAAALGGSEFLFPQARLRSKGDEGGGYMSAKVLADALQSAMGKHISPHDMRRALATHGPDILKIRDEDVKLILNHAATRNQVTGRHYALHESMPWKVSVMEKWEGWLADLIRRAAPPGHVWPGFLTDLADTPQAAPLMLAAE